MTRRQRDNLTYGGIALCSVIFLLWVIPAQTPPYPGYGVSAALVPNVAFGLILVFSVLLLLFNLLAYRAEKSEKLAPHAVRLSEDIRQEDRVHFWRLALFMILCLLLMPAMQWIGFIPAGIAFMLAMQYLCGQRKPVTLVLVAIVPVCFMYVALLYGLGVPMP